MWMWRVCAKGMEKQITDLTVLKKYQNRQVIINYYLNEDYLDERIGFHFLNISIAEECVAFSMENKNYFTISLAEFPNVYLNDDFQNYYIFRNSSNHVEVYFP